MRLGIEAIGLLGPGLPDWQQAQAALLSPDKWQWAEAVVPAPTGLPGAERRRVGQAVKVAMAAAHQACEASEFDASTLPSVFSSSGGDGQNCHILCEALTEPAPQLSPTRFTNSVHNAPSGYWSIASGCQAASTSICAYDASFSAGLIEAGLFANSEQTPVLLVAYDVPYPSPLSAVREIATPFAVALVLTPGLSASAPPAAVTLTFNEAPAGAESTMPGDAMEALRLGAPAARALPLLDAVANRRPVTINLPGTGDTIIPVSVSFR